MEYTVIKLARLAGVTPRTIRHYHQIGLLEPCKVTTAGYRVYSGEQVMRLQQIMFYRKLGVGLSQVLELLKSEQPEAALEKHIISLKEQRTQLDSLIENAEKTILAMKGKVVMKDSERFSGFKEKMVKENEEKYGAEVRASYGEQALEGSNKALLDMSEGEWGNMEELAQNIHDELKQAVELGEPGGEAAQKACEMHRRWITSMWGFYDEDSHMGLVEMYLADERFKKYYDDVTPGATQMLHDAMVVFLNRK